MGKKAKRRNGFSIFMYDFRRKEEAKGVRFGNDYQNLAKLAGEAWFSVPQSVKDDYKKKADEYNKSEERSQGIPLPGVSVGKKKKKPPPPLNRALGIKEAKQRREKLFVQNLVEGMTINDLLDHVFYLSHVNVFCKTEDDEFVPAEIAISKFSLREGVTDVFHRILNPGVTPLGYSYTIKEHSEKTHRIPLDYVKATHGYLGMYKGITDFLRSTGNSGGGAQLYTMFDEPFHNCSMSAVKYSLKRIWETSNFDDDDEETNELTEDEPYEKVFKVLSLPILFFHLKNRCASALDDNARAFENTSEANIELLNDKYEFDEDLACMFHKEIDNVRHCSQSYTVRWAQVIREQCLKNLESDEEPEEKGPEPINEETEKLKKERDLVSKEEKPEEIGAIKKEKEDKYDIKKEKDRREIKDERDRREIKDERDRDSHYKRERDDRHRHHDDPRYKKERDRGYSDERVKRERDRRYDDDRIKQERDRGYGDDRIKRERDRGYGDDRIKRERDRGYDDDRIKRERDRGYSDERYKRERDRGYDDARVKRERDDRHRSSEDVRVKKEREDRQRRSETDDHSRIKRENVDPDYDILKEEHLDIPSDVKIERTGSRDSCPRNSRPKEEDTSKMKIEREEIPVKIKTERPDDYKLILKTEHLDIPLDVKTERVDSVNQRPTGSNGSHDPKSIPTTKHVDIPHPVDIKIERVDSVDQRPTTSNKSHDVKPMLKTEHLDIPLDIKTERVDNADQRPSGSNKSSDPKSRTVSDTSQPTTLKKERDSEFPLPIPIKEEFPSRTKPSSKETKSSEASNVPPSISIKVEKGSDVGKPRKETKSFEASNVPPSLPIKVEKGLDVCKQRAEDSSKNDFPMPMIIKVEKGETAKQFAPKQSENDFPMPITIKIEKPEKSQSRNNTQRDDDFPLPKKIKIENEPMIKAEPSTSSSSQSQFERVKKEPQDFYSAHGLKNEDMEIDIEDLESLAPSDSESILSTSSDTKAVVVKEEHTRSETIDLTDRKIKIENVDD